MSTAGAATWEPANPSGRRLTDREADLLRLLASGHTDREIANRLYLSPHTVKHQLDRLRDRLDMRNRIELAAWAGASGYYGAAFVRRAGGSGWR
jgi:DNA-binding CsgD family transcriptional regulator